MHDYSCPAHLPYPHVQISASNGGLGPPHFDGCNHTPLGILAPTRPLAEPRGMVCERFPWRNGLRYARVRQEGLDGHYDGERMELQRADVDRNPGMLYHCLLTWMGYCYVRSDPKIWKLPLERLAYYGVRFPNRSIFHDGQLLLERALFSGPSRGQLARKDYPIKFLKRLGRNTGKTAKSMPPH